MPRSDSFSSAQLSEALREIASGTVTRAEAALRLEISERHMNRLMNRYGVKRPLGSVRAARAERTVAATARRKLLLRLARQVLGNEISPEAAAKAGECSVRAMYRWISEARAGRIE